MSTLLPVDAETLPRSLVLDPPLTDAEFEALCRANDGVQFERTKEGVIRMNPPAGGLTGDGNSEINYQLRGWWEKHLQGRVFDSNTGFYLPDNSMLSPDAAYVASAQLTGLTKAQLTGFPHLCPEFVIELLSASDGLAEAQRKMIAWIANGAQLAWLVDPYGKRVFNYQPGAKMSIFTGMRLKGSGPADGFTLDLGKVWSCYEV